MSDHQDSIPAPKSIGELSQNIVSAVAAKMQKNCPTDSEVIDAFRQLEHDIASLHSMAKILNDLLDTYLIDFDTKAQSGKILTIKLGDHEMNMLSFAWNDVSYRAGRLENAFYAAGNGEIVQ